MRLQTKRKVPVQILEHYFKKDCQNVFMLNKTSATGSSPLHGHHHRNHRIFQFRRDLQGSESSCQVNGPYREQTHSLGVTTPCSEQLSYSILLGTDAMRKAFAVLWSFQQLLLPPCVIPPKSQKIGLRDIQTYPMTLITCSIYSFSALEFLLFWEGWVSKDPVGEEKISAWSLPEQ